MERLLSVRLMIERLEEEWDWKDAEPAAQMMVNEVGYA